MRHSAGESAGTSRTGSSPSAAAGPQVEVALRVVAGAARLAGLRGALVRGLPAEQAAAGAEALRAREHEEHGEPGEQADRDDGGDLVRPDDRRGAGRRRRGAGRRPRPRRPPRRAGARGPARSPRPATRAARGPATTGPGASPAASTVMNSAITSPTRRSRRPVCTTDCATWTPTSSAASSGPTWVTPSTVGACEPRVSKAAYAATTARAAHAGGLARRERRRPGEDVRGVRPGQAGDRSRHRGGDPEQVGGDQRGETVDGDRGDQDPQAERAPVGAGHDATGPAEGDGAGRTTSGTKRSPAAFACGWAASHQARAPWVSATVQLTSAQVRRQPADRGQVGRTGRAQRGAPVEDVDVLRAHALAPVDRRRVAGEQADRTGRTARSRRRGRRPPTPAAPSRASRRGR